MGLRKQAGNMYPWVTHTWNPIKGKCMHECSYCYMKKFNLKEIRLDEKELKTDLSKAGPDAFIFVGSGTDMFADNIPAEWIIRILTYCRKREYDGNRYLFQTKNPRRFIFFSTYFPVNSVFGTTIETDRDYPIYMGKTPNTIKRAYALKEKFGTKMVTIEPIMDFDYLAPLIELIKPDWVNIGADSKGHNLPEPPKEKIEALINELSKFTEVKIKSNLKRLMI